MEHLFQAFILTLFSFLQPFTTGGFLANFNCDLLIYYLNFIEFRFLGVVVGRSKYYWDDLIVLALPLLMYTFGHQSLLMSFFTWFKILLFSSFWYGLMTINGGHHHNDIFHDGDEIKSMDFGVYQLAATFDRTDSLDNHFLAITTFGQHVLRKKKLKF